MAALAVGLILGCTGTAEIAVPPDPLKICQEGTVPRNRAAEIWHPRVQDAVMHDGGWMVLESIARGGNTRVVSLDDKMQLQWEYVHVIEDAESFSYDVVPQSDGSAVVIGTLLTPVPGNTPIDKIPKNWDERHGFWLAVNEGKVTGEKRFGGPGRDDLDVGAAHPAGGVVAAGSTTDEKDQALSWVAHLSKDGAIEWEVKPGQPGQSAVKGIMPFGDGLIIAGKELGSAYVALLDAKGQEQWRKTPGEGFVVNIVPAGDGMALVLEQFLEEQYLVVRLDGSGEVLWKTVVKVPGDGVVRKLAALPDGGVAVVGGAHKIETHHNQYKTAFVAALGADGTIAWQQEIPGGYWQFAADITIRNDGSWVLWGTRESADE
ncbi:MAG: hypothetical protein HN348_35365, partial [Proteobacteria bacterium]|nr:hypothetical protein [Pseudomonadota bacterium]